MAGFPNLRENDELLAASLCVSAALAAASFLLQGASQFKNFELLLVFFVASPPFLAVFYRDYLEERRLRRVEEALPSALFQLSSFPPRAPVEVLVRSVAEADYGELSLEFRKAQRQVSSGVPVRDALEAIPRRTRSLLLERVIALMLAAHEGGGNASGAFRQVAEDAFKLSSIARETTASATLHKYTLLAAGAFIIPAVLGLLHASTQNFSSSSLSLSELGVGLSQARQASLRETVLLANQIYLAVFAVVAGFFVARTEGSYSKAAFYALFLAACSLLVFAFASGLKLG